MADDGGQHLWMQVICLTCEFFLKHRPPIRTKLTPAERADQDPIGLTRAADPDLERVTNFSEYAELHYDGWVAHLRTGGGLGTRCPELGRAHFWSFFFQFYCDVCAWQDARDADDGALQEDLARRMLRRWFHVDVPLDPSPLRGLRSMTAFCFTGSPWLCDPALAESTQFRVRRLWVTGALLDPNDPADMRALCLQLAKRRPEMLGLAVACAVLNADAPAGQPEDSEPGLGQLFDAMLGRGPHDLALGPVTSLEECRRRNPVLHYVSSTQDPPFCRVAVIRPEGAKLSNACAIVVQGAVEHVLPLCGARYRDHRPEDATDEWRQTAHAALQTMELHDLRTVATAHLPHLTTSDLEGIADWADVRGVWRGFQDLPPFTFVGLAGVAEPRLAPATDMRIWRDMGVRVCFASALSAREAQLHAQSAGLLPGGAVVVDGRELDGFTAEDWHTLFQRNGNVVLSRAGARHREALVARLTAAGARVGGTLGFVAADCPTPPSVVFAQGYARDSGGLGHVLAKDGQITFLTRAVAFVRAMYAAE